MSNTFFVLCEDNNNLIVYRLEINENIQSELTTLFHTQEQSFREGIEDEIDFTGDWKPDTNEFLCVKISEQTDILLDAFKKNALSVPVLNIQNIETANIKAVFTGKKGAKEQDTVILIQRFSPQQLLTRKYALIYSTNTLNKITDPAFTLNTNLVAIIENDKLKFKSYSNIRSIFDMTTIYREATDEDIKDFSTQNCILINDVSSFSEKLDQIAKRLIHSIHKNKRLDNKTAAEIEKRANSFDLKIDIENGKIVMPLDRADIKTLLRFINDDIYEAPLSEKRYVTNSKKPV